MDWARGGGENECFIATFCEAVSISDDYHEPNRVAIARNFYQIHISWNKPTAGIVKAIKPVISPVSEAARIYSITKFHPLVP